MFGATIYHNLNFTVGYDGAPASTYVVPPRIARGPRRRKVASPGVIFGGVADTTIKDFLKGDVTCAMAVASRPRTPYGYTSDPSTRPR